MVRLKELIAKWEQAAKQADKNGRFINANGFYHCAAKLKALLPELEAELAALRAPGPCGKHPKMFLAHDNCHHCCQHQETNGKLPHDCTPVCTLCADLALEKAAALRMAADFVRNLHKDPRELDLDYAERCVLQVVAKRMEDALISPTDKKAFDAYGAGIFAAGVSRGCEIEAAKVADKVAAAMLAESEWWREHPCVYGCEVCRERLAANRQAVGGSHANFT
jgi:hypothetical protein